MIKNKINISLEFFPPKTDQLEEKLYQEIEKLKILKPNFVSVTYGAGGSTRKRTHDIVLNIAKENNFAVAAHLTCVGSTKQEINEIAKDYFQSGIKHIVALRGDLPNNQDLGDYKYANQLVSALKDIADFKIFVAAYPEKHPEASNLDQDIDNLKKKIDAGADKIITQFFFDNSYFYKFLNKIRQKNINIPVIPGILPIHDINQVQNFAKRCGSNVPKAIIDQYQSDIDPLIISKNITVKQCRDLYDNNIRDFHFYSLNKADLLIEICNDLGFIA
ncbi:methylenetetrahydrofolate reductase [NAD(P)H] [Rickettsiales bacterium]|nr:methylenetetrahydrofolate reductase [NAD(P)H] [Rickettsiales bacterium]MDB2550667.1 methylenetetrahydrofolate reductase [NAD(P)H] [Rickettsiales bacterium]